MRRAVLAALLLAAPAAVSAETLVVLWDQSPEANITGYRVFVGTASGRYTETFDVPRVQTSLAYASAVPGRRYYFAVAAQVDDAVWGPRSIEIAETAATAALPDHSRLSVASTPSPAAVSSIAGAANELTTIEVVASGLRPVTALAVSDAGVGLLVEGGNVVRAFDAAGVRAEPALELDEDVRLEGLALDPAFDRTGRAFLAASRTRREGGREVTIERHRYLSGRLGEGLALVPGLRGDDASATSIAVAPDGRIAAVQFRALLTFTPDGHLADAQGATPGHVAWDAAGQAVWVAGRDMNGGIVVERLTTSQAAPQVRSFAPGTLEADTPISVVAQAGTVHVTSVQADAVMIIDPSTGASTRLPASIATYGRPVTVAEGPGPATAWYVAVRETRPDGATLDTLLRVTVRPGAGLPIQH